VSHSRRGELPASRRWPPRPSSGVTSRPRSPIGRHLGGARGGCQTATSEPSACCGDATDPRHENHRTDRSGPSIGERSTHRSSRTRGPGLTRRRIPHRLNDRAIEPLDQTSVNGISEGLAHGRQIATATSRTSTGVERAPGLARLGWARFVTELDSPSVTTRSRAPAGARHQVATMLYG
jgi:hypothetical protein